LFEQIVRLDGVLDEADDLVEILQPGHQRMARTSDSACPFTFARTEKRAHAARQPRNRLRHLRR
jgi:hypothetical protein